MQIWKISVEDVERLKGFDREFAELMNDLLYQEARGGGLSDTDLRLNMNVLAPDGGVDAAVDKAIPGPGGASGYFGVPTCWQYKATSTGNIKPPKGETGGQPAGIAHEMNKPEVRNLISRGYGYRFCITDELTPPRIAEWEGWMDDEAKKIKSDAAPSRVLTASRLKDWINRYAGLIRSIRTDLGPFRDFKTWGHEIQHLTNHYHPVPAWADKLQTIREFADFSRQPSRAVLPIRGEAGVGKTRCVYEALLLNQGIKSVVVYTTNESDAEDLANQLTANPELTALIVADECSQLTAVKLDRNLRAHSKRLRVISIDNQQQSEQTSLGELRLDRLTRDDVEKILAINYQGLPPDRLRAFANLSEGFVRLAVDLCDNDHLIPPDGSIGISLTEFFRRTYLAARLEDEELNAVLIVSLVTRVGFTGDVSSQLEDLCKMFPDVGLSAARVIHIARKLKQSPGFIAIGERYLYVTPRLIAQAAFRAAWDRWARHAPNDLFVHLTRDLTDQFMRQLRDAGTDEMRRASSDFFMTWTSNFSEEDLADESKVLLLVRLADVEPNTLLPQIRRLIQSVSITNLRSLHASAGLDVQDYGLIQRGHKSQEARRQLVWFAERFLMLPEHFADAEQILYRLALAETESYGNNAAGVWRQIFQFLLSGTPMPFRERLDILEARFEAANDESIKLLVGGLDSAITGFAHGASRVLGPSMVAGRIPPPDWRPASDEEFEACWTAAVSLLQRLARHTQPLIRERALKLTVDRFSTLVLLGSLNLVQDIFDDSSRLTDTLLAKLLHEIDQFLEVFCKGDSRRVPESTESRVRLWRGQLVPSSLHGKIVASVGQEAWWQFRTGQTDIDPVTEDLSRTLLEDSAAFDRELPWLLSGEANSAFQFGVTLGELDEAGSLLEQILDAAVGRSHLGFARGYVKALAERHPLQIDRINLLLDRYEQEYSKSIFDIISTGPEQLRPFTRLLAMVDGGHLPPVYLRGIAHGGQRILSPNELSEVLSRLIYAGNEGDADALRAALDVVWTQFRLEERVPAETLRKDSAIQDQLALLLRSSIPDAGRGSHAWDDLLGRLCDSNPDEAISIAAAGLSSLDFFVAETAASHLTRAALSHPEKVMDQFGSALLSPSTGPYLNFRQLTNVVNALPFQTLKTWLERNGEAAAVSLARHLPPPYLEGNAPQVPELTAFVLEQFERSESVIREFCAGVLSSRGYSGDITGQIRQEGEVARKFLGHRLKRVQEWARYEIERVNEMVAFWRARDEEDAGPR
jgi:hypothetical protein